MVLTTDNICHVNTHDDFLIVFFSVYTFHDSALIFKPKTKPNAESSRFTVASIKVEM
jgi:hypothetical protein